MSKPGFKSRHPDTKICGFNHWLFCRPVCLSLNNSSDGTLSQEIPVLLVGGFRMFSLLVQAIDCCPKMVFYYLNKKKGKKESEEHKNKTTQSALPPSNIPGLLSVLWVSWKDTKFPLSVVSFESKIPTLCVYTLFQERFKVAQMDYKT